TVEVLVLVPCPEPVLLVLVVAPGGAPLELPPPLWASALERTIAPPLIPSAPATTTAAANNFVLIVTPSRRPLARAATVEGIPAAGAVGKKWTVPIGAAGTLPANPASPPSASTAGAIPRRVSCSSNFCRALHNRPESVPRGQPSRAAASG